MIATYYCVKSCVDNHGRMTAAITESVEAEEHPTDSYISTSRGDIYTDWFESREEAKKFVSDARSS